MTEGIAARDKIPIMTATVTPPEAAPLPSAPPPPPLERTSYGDRVFRTLLTVGAVSVPVLLGFLVYQLWTGSALAIVWTWLKTAVYLAS